MSNTNDFVDDHNNDGDDIMVIINAILVLSPYICVSLVISFILHYLLFEPIATHSLLNEYEKNGILTVGKIISSSSTKISNIDDDKVKRDGSKKDSAKKMEEEDSIVVVEVMYEAPQHRYANNATMKIKHPDAYETKQFVRKFGISTLATVGQPQKNSNTRTAKRDGDIPTTVELLRLPKMPQSGYPVELIQQQLQVYNSKQHSQRIKQICVVGSILMITSLGLTVQQVYSDNIQDKSAAWSAFIIGLIIIGTVPFLYWEDQFVKNVKLQRFLSAQIVSLKEKTN